MTADATVHQSEAIPEERERGEREGGIGRWEREHQVANSNTKANSQIYNPVEEATSEQSIPVAPSCPIAISMERILKECQIVKSTSHSTTLFDSHTARKLILNDANGGIKWSKILTLVLPFQYNCSLCAWSVQE